MREGDLAPLFVAQPFNRIPEYDPGKPEHYWIISAVWKINPYAGHEGLLDKENMVAMFGPACYFCQEYIFDADEVCPGDADD